MAENRAFGTKNITGPTDLSFHAENENHHSFKIEQVMTAMTVTSLYGLDHYLPSNSCAMDDKLFGCS
jgi:hypothetical protein